MKLSERLQALIVDSEIPLSDAWARLIDDLKTSEGRSELDDSYKALDERPEVVAYLIRNKERPEMMGVRLNVDQSCFDTRTETLELMTIIQHERIVESMSREIEPRITQPARIGGVVFQPGIKVASVIGAAYRAAEYEHPEGKAAFKAE